MSKVNKLTSSILLQEQSKLFLTKKVTVNINKKDYEVLVDQKFIPTKIQQLIQEGISNLDNFNGLDDSVRTSYFFYLIIKYFSNIEIAKTDSFEDQIRIMNSMINLEIFDKILGEFEESELEKVNEYISKFNGNLNELLKDEKGMEYLKKIMGDGLVDVDGELVGKVDESDNESENVDINEETDELVNKIEITDTE